MKTQKAVHPFLSWTHVKSSVKTGNRSPSEKRRCNLCGGRYRAPNSFSRFCRTCRLESELYRMAEWVPTVELPL